MLGACSGGSSEEQPTAPAAAAETPVRTPGAGNTPSMTTAAPQSTPSPSATPASATAPPLSPAAPTATSVPNTPPPAATATPTTPPPPSTIRGGGESWAPAYAVVPVGHTLTVSWGPGQLHNLAIPGILNETAASFSGSFPVTFNTPGTYQILCILHPAMTATVVVQ